MPNCLSHHRKKARGGDEGDKPYGVKVWLNQAKFEGRPRTLHRGAGTQRPQEPEPERLHLTRKFEEFRAFQKSLESRGFGIQSLVIDASLSNHI